ncbi:hypothetical protein R6Q57_019423 [Mikania cordata]
MDHHHHHHHRKTHRSQTLPSSPTHSSDFEFRVSVSPRKSSATNLCPADDLFYKGQLLPLHLSPRISMVRTLLLSSTSTSSSSARHSSDSHSSFSTDGCDSSRPSSATDDDPHLHLHLHTKLFPSNSTTHPIHVKKNKYFSLSRFSSVFRKNPNTQQTTHNPDIITGSSVKRMSVTAKEMIRKYLKKAKPLYEKLSQKTTSSPPPPPPASKTGRTRNETVVISQSFSGNLRYPRRRSCVSSCPSSMRSSPSHSRTLCRGNFVQSSESSSMEELQSAIQGAIAHCKKSMIQNN